MLELLIGGLVLYFGYHFVRGYLKAGKAHAKPHRSTRPHDKRANREAAAPMAAQLLSHVDAHKEPLGEGFSRYESQPEVLVDGVEIKTTDGATLTLPFKVTSTLVIERDEVFADLNRQATQARSEGDMDKAVAFLKQAKQRQGDAYEDTRLALYLQHAGRFDEAMAEFDWLLNHLEQQVESALAHTTPTSRKARLAYGRQVIHNKARLVCKREGRNDLAQLHGKLTDQYEQEAHKLRTAADRAERRSSQRRHEKLAAKLFDYKRK